MIRFSVSADDINRFLASLPEAEVRYRQGTFQITRQVAAMRITAAGHLDLRDGRARVALPFAEMRTERTGALLGRLTSMLWPRWLEPWLERTIADKLTAEGLPWDLVWVDTIDDRELGRIGTINFSPHTLNEWLRRKVSLDGLAPRLVSVDLQRDQIVFGIELIELGGPAGERRE